MKWLIGLLSIILIISMLPLHASLPTVPIGKGPTMGTNLFFDDFLGSGFPSNWAGYSEGTLAIGNVTQNGGFASVRVTGNSVPTTPSSRQTEMYNNASSPPLFNSLFPESVQFREVVVRAQPFNYSNPYAIGSSSAVFFSYETIGMNVVVNAGAVGLQGIYFFLVQTNGRLNQIISSWPATKQAIFLDVYDPTVSPANTFCSAKLDNCTFKDILYSVPNSFDLNAMHTFTIQSQMDYNNTSNDYIRFQVDNNGWMGFSQTSCSCILGGTGDVLKLFPSVAVYNAVVPIQTLTISQSVAAQVDYFLLTDYVPSAFPSGQLLPSAAVPPKLLPQPGVTGSLTDFMQFEANSLAPGNIYGGGMMLMGIIGMVIFSVMGLAAKKGGTSLKTFGFAFTMTVLVLSFFGFITQILPIWVPVMTTIIAIGITFGVIKTGSSSGGLVPD